MYLLINYSFFLKYCRLNFYESKINFRKFTN